MTAMKCPCGTDKTLGRCCGPLINGKKPAASPEALMRARYTAYATGEIDYIMDTQDPDTAGEIDRSATESWSKDSEWLGFELIDTEMAEDEVSGTVDFTARYKRQGQEHAHHEQASFRKIDDGWFFVDSKMAEHETFRRSERKVGRNEPCPCGSGKKYKRCCGGG